MITVFGGTGFLGRVLVRQLIAGGEAIRVVTRRSTGTEGHPPSSAVESYPADIREESAVAEALKGATGAINAVGLYVEDSESTFEAVHNEGAARLARLAREGGLQYLVHISGIGSDPSSRFPYIAARGRGEKAVRHAFPDAVILRPSVLFGPGDAFLQSLDTLTRLPLVPLFGRGQTRLQPAYVEDVAAAAIQALQGSDALGQTYELGGADICTYREAVELVLAHRGRWRPLAPIPFSAWKGLASALSILPRPPFTSDQIALLERDNVVSAGSLTFTDLGVTPSGLRERLAECLPPSHS